MSVDWELIAITLSATLGGGIIVAVGNATVAWIRRPRLRIEFEDKESYCTRTPVTSHDPAEPEVEAVYLRARVVNHGKSTARSCRAFIVHIKVTDEGGAVHTIDDMDSVQIPWSVKTVHDNSIAVIDLPVGVNQFVDLAVTVSNDDSQALHPTALVFPHRFRHLFSKPGRFEMTVMVVADNTEPDQRKVKFRWQGTWDTLRPDL